MTTYIPREKVIEAIYDLIVQHGSQNAVAKLLGIKPSYLSDILHGHREISEKVAREIGYYRRVVFEEMQG